MPVSYRPTAFRYPSEDDDVVTSPYNSVLAMRQHTEFADCVIPIENQSLADLVTRCGTVGYYGLRWPCEMHLAYLEPVAIFVCHF
jgi:hypothetical protein